MTFPLQRDEHEFVKERGDLQGGQVPSLPIAVDY